MASSSKNSVNELSKNQIDDMFEIVANEVDNDGFLDHETRAIELLQLKKIWSVEGKNVKAYKIMKTKDIDLDVGTGRTYIYKYGASMVFSGKGTRLQQIVAVGHELGHVYLDHINTLDASAGLGFTLKIKDPILEAQATYFSKKIVERRSNQYYDDDFITGRQFKLPEIERAILAIHPTYDENVLK